MYVIEILERCSDFAKRSARVYRNLAERFTDDTDRVHLWRELALEEETHADILRRELQSFQEQDQAGSFLPDFVDRVTLADRELAKLEDRARSANSLDELLAVSVALEQTTLEDLYDDLILQGEPAFRLISERLEAALSELPGTPAAAGLARQRRRTR
jgi:rubrerythrin